MVGEGERLVPELGRLRRELLGLGRPVEERVRASGSGARRSRPSTLRAVVEIGEGELIFSERRARCHAPRRRRAARCASKCAPLRPGQRRRSTSMRDTPRRFSSSRESSRSGSRIGDAPDRPRDLGVRPARGRARIRGDGRRAGAVPRPPRAGLGTSSATTSDGSSAAAASTNSRRPSTPPPIPVSSSSDERDGEEGETITDRPERRATCSWTPTSSRDRSSLRRRRARRAAARPPRATPTRSSSSRAS